MLATPRQHRWWESNSASLHQTQGASQVTDEMAASKAKADKTAARAEAKDAAEFAKSEEGKAALARQKDKTGRGVRNHIRERGRDAVEQLKQKPIRTLTKGALVGGAVIGAGALTGGLGGIAIGAGALAAGAPVGKSGVAKTARTLNPTDRLRSQADRISAYRSAHGGTSRVHDVDVAHQQALAEQKRRQKGDDSGQSTPSAHPGAVPSGQDHDLVDQVEPAQSQVPEPSQDPNRG